MTIRQQVHRLIDRLPESCIRPVVEILKRMLPQTEAPAAGETSKQQAFRELEKLRKQAAQYHFPKRTGMRAWKRSTEASPGVTSHDERADK